MLKQTQASNGHPSSDQKLSMSALDTTAARARQLATAMKPMGRTWTLNDHFPSKEPSSVSDETILRIASFNQRWNVHPDRNRTMCVAASPLTQVMHSSSALALKTLCSARVSLVLHSQRTRPLDQCSSALSATCWTDEAITSYQLQY